MNREMIDALKQIEREKNIPMDMLLETLEDALLAAYKRNYTTAYDARVNVDPETGEIRVYAINEDGSEEEVTPNDFGRIAAQTARQVILQRIREVERDIMYEEFKDREGDIVNGIIQQSDQRYTLVDLGRVEALLPSHEQAAGERYDHGSRVKAYVIEVKKSTKGPQIIVSRTHPSLLRRLFELEVPEIAEGFVEINSVAREAGYRSKIAVSSNDENVDPVGACVGAKGSRVRMVVSELRGEKTDIVKWSDDSAVFIANALSPAKVGQVLVNDKTKKALVIAPEDQLSLAIGKEGQNVRLAAKLTGWRIDIKSDDQVTEDEVEAFKKDAAVVTSAEAQCEAVTTKSTRCKRKALPGSRFCKLHGPKA